MEDKAKTKLGKKSESFKSVICRVHGADELFPKTRSFEKIFVCNLKVTKNNPINQLINRKRYIIYSFQNRF